MRCSRRRLFQYLDLQLSPGELLLQLVDSFGVGEPWLGDLVLHGE